MCGRYTLTADLFQVKIHYDVDLLDPRPAEAWKPRFSFARTQLAPVAEG